MTDIYLGRIVKAFGIKGELKFHPSEDFWEDVLESKRLTVHSRGEDDGATSPLALERVRPHGRSYVVKVRGIDDRNAAESLVGGDVFVSDDELDVDYPEMPLPFQLIGMTVADEAGERLGEVTSVLYSAAHDIYEITGERGSFLVPAVPEFVLSIDRDARSMVVKTLPGLIEE